MALEQYNKALMTDLYEITMAASYFEHGMHDRRAGFEMFVRHLPPNRSYLIAAGLEQVLSYLENLSFTSEQIDYLRSQDVFQDVGEGFWNYLADFRFTGNVRAIPEGMLAFPEEPLLSVDAPIIEAQIVETFVLTMLNYQTLVASKAARVTGAACLDGQERAVVDFGSRRAHGPEAGVLAARGSYIGGCKGTSNVEAGQQMGIPISGTQAHSYVMAFDTEQEAFQSYYDSFPHACVLLIDTYDVLEGARKAIETAPGMQGVRIDSGDIVSLSTQVRELLDEAGLEDAMVFASGNLDEYRIAELVQNGAQVDGFGVGTALVTSLDNPALGGVYKLIAVQKDGEWQPRIKLSTEKATYPGFKQVYRVRKEPGGEFSHDVLAAQEEDPPEGGEPLLKTFMENGETVADLPELESIRHVAQQQLQSLPERYRQLENTESYTVRVSEGLEKTYRSLAEEVRGDE